MSKLLGSLVLASMLFGCAAAPRAPGAASAAPKGPKDPRDPNDQGIAVSLALLTPRKDTAGERAVQPGESMGSGDMLAMQIRVDRPSYVYVLHTTAAGDVQVLYPAEAEVQARPGEVVRVPAVGDWFEVGGPQGAEHMVVVASTQALTPAAVKEAQQQSKSDSDKKPDDNRSEKKEPQRPPCSSKASDECKRGDPTQLAARAGLRGIAVVRFPFQHR